MRARRVFLRGNPSRPPSGTATPRRGRSGRHRVRRAVRWALALVAVSGAAALAHGGLDFLRSDRSFCVREIHVVGLDSRDPLPLLDALQDLRGRNLFQVGPEAVQVRLAPFGWVAGFLCRKHLPDTLVVEVRERHGLCTAGAGERVLEIDGRGGVWPAPPGSAADIALEPGLTPEDPGLQALLAGLVEAGGVGQVVRVGRGPGGSYALSTVGGWRALASSSGFAEQWAKFAQARESCLDRLGAAGTLDLRWSSKVVLVPEPASAGTAPGPAQGGGNHG